MINVTSAFSMGIGGSMSKAAADVYNQTLTSIYDGMSSLGGWLGGAVQSVVQSHENFMNSNMWEFSKRIGKDGHYVGRFDVGYLSEVGYQQQAVGLMRNYIMANPKMMELYEADRISGYDGEISDLCSGIGRDNYFYNRAVDGLMRIEDDEAVRTHYATSLDKYTHLSAMERVDIKRTWAASNIHIAKNLFDPSSISGGKILSVEEVEAIQKQMEEEAGDAQ
ncbi:hypothetical protein D6_0047 [Aeromonas phage D6]|uniref:Uncharacterized protein n=2 Tax=Ludhianavirus TaxID=3044751 RepID=A0A514A1J7_9CAUD|nr:hypothetical protein PQC06_gp215 [Aeromonas phage LAh10]YP_010668795.1 hypothetical protein PQC08_gp228 [Aeromonas phage D6]QDH47134.1 hypothetical protein LAh10_214 [Aeromonas phage LAh10]QDJ97207.1 hypothetical protein D6_0047 [Aeromonas phage D6]